MKKQRLSFLPALSLVLIFVFVILSSFNLSVFADDIYGVYVTENSSSIDVSSQAALNGDIWMVGDSAPQVLTGSYYFIYAGAVEISTDTNIGNVRANYNSAVINSPVVDIAAITASQIDLYTPYNIGNISSNENFISVKDALSYPNLFASYITAQANEIGDVNANLNKIEVENSNGPNIYAIIADISLSSPAAFNINANRNEVSVSSSAFNGIVATEIYTGGVSNAVSDNNKIIVSYSTISYIQGSYLNINNSAYSDAESRAQTNGNIISITNSHFFNSFNVSGAYAFADSSFANNNEILIDKFFGDNTGGIYIYGGGANGRLSAQANENIIDVKNITGSQNVYIYGANVFGSYGPEAGVFTANKNSVNIKNMYIDVNNNFDVRIYGAYNSAEGIFVNANENSVYIENSVVSEVYGGYAEIYNSFDAKIRANQNFVKLVNNLHWGDIFGGKSYSNSSGLISNFADGNEVHIINGSFGSVYGGYAESFSSNAQSNGNIVNIEEVLSGGFVIGGYVAAPAANASAFGNSVNIKSAQEINGIIAGGYIERGFNVDIAFNSVVLDDSVFNGLVLFGGVSYNNAENDAFVNNNAILVKGGSLNVDIYGGGALSLNGKAAANENRVELKNVSGAWSLRGGFAQSIGGQAFANGNEIVIENISAGAGFIAGGFVIGNFDGGQIEAVNNTISITGGLAANDVIYGGFAINNGTGGADYRSGNTFNIIDGQITAYGIGGFENYNFYIGNLNVSSPAIYASNGDGLSHFVGGTDGAVDISSTNIKIFLPANTNIGIGQEIRLIESGLGFTGEPNSSEITAKQGVAWLNTFDIYVDTNNANLLNAGFTGRTFNPQTKNLSESIAAGAALVGQGADIFGGLLANIKEEKLEVLGAVFGGSSKYETGSSVEINALGLIAGAAKKFKPVTAGVFVEYADGSYDTENDFDGYDSVKGDGKASYTGGGLLAKKDIKENIYVEGQVRAGQISNDYKTGLSDGQGNAADFDYSAIYFGLNIGAGYKYKVSEKVSVKGYGKYIFTNVGGGDADLSTGEKYEFNAVMSNRIKAGIKGAYKISEKVKPYIGIGYDYEISGEINAKIGGEKIAAPTLNGGTFQGEAGASVKVIENLNIDVSAQIYTGAREGFSGVFKLKYEI